MEEGHLTHAHIMLNPNLAKAEEDRLYNTYHTYKSGRNMQPYEYNKRQKFVQHSHIGANAFTAFERVRCVALSSARMRA